MMKVSIHELPPTTLTPSYTCFICSCRVPPSPSFKGCTAACLWQNLMMAGALANVAMSLLLLLAVW